MKVAALGHLPNLDCSGGRDFWGRYGIRRLHYSGGEKRREEDSNRKKERKIRTDSSQQGASGPTLHQGYRGTSLKRNTPPVRLYSSVMPREPLYGSKPEACEGLSKINLPWHLRDGTSQERLEIGFDAS